MKFANVGFLFDKLSELYPDLFTEDTTKVRICFNPEYPEIKVKAYITYEYDGEIETVFKELGTANSVQMCEVFEEEGLDPNKVSSFTISLGVDSAVVIDFEYYVSQEFGEGIISTLKGEVK